MKAYAIAQLPERFKAQPQSKPLAQYISAKYSQYGYKRNRSILFGPEFIPESQECAYNPDKFRWVENVSDGLRKTGDSHEILPRLGHTGWFTDDDFQDETVHGEVYQLPCRNGEEQYIPAVSNPCNSDCACLDFHSVTSDKEDAARWADQMAEQWAEREREYRAREDAKQRLEEITEEIKAEYQDFRRIARELRANCDAVIGVAVVRELVRDRWKQTKAEIHRLRREQRKIEENGYSLED